MRTVGILLCDDLGEGLETDWENYQALFKVMIRNSGKQCRFRTWSCHRGELPDSAEQCDAWVVTGSRSSAYESLAWVQNTQSVLRRIAETRSRLLGVCFGHQMVHQALGGTVWKSPSGWGMGAYTNRVYASFGGFQSGETLRLLSIHQDQVKQMAPEFSVLAGGEFCPYYVTKRGNNVLTVQGHPEFDQPFLRAVMARVGERAGRQTIERAHASLQEPDQGERFRQYLREFLLPEG